MKRRLVYGTVVLVLACSAPEARSSQEVPHDALGGEACENADGAFSGSSFVLVTRPAPGERVASGFTVVGCSSTFEANVQWRLVSRRGDVVASGFTTGGGMTPGPFSFSVAFAISDQQIGHLEVYEEDVSEGEGYPPGKTVLPLVLSP